MTRTPLPLQAEDISAFAKSLRRQLADAPHPPGHLALLNMLARSAGARNFQHLKALGDERPAAPAAGPPPEPFDLSRLDRLARHFDAQGRMTRWPSRAGDIAPCLWVLWSRLPAHQAMTEIEISQRLDREHLFGDRAILRRELVGHGLATRTLDGSRYERVEAEPPPLALALIRQVAAGS